MKVVQRVSINGRLVEIGLADAQMAVEQGQATLERSDDDSVKMKQSLRLNPTTSMKAPI